MKCPECDAILKPVIEDEVNVVRCVNCHLVWRGPVNLADMEVSSEIEDALTDVYLG